jgi:MoaA/NifB/PqqE/SkfB family radical SAM enzyme
MTDIKVPDGLTDEMKKSRERLRLLKPRVYEKLMKYLEAEERGDVLTPSLIDWTYGFECNFKCPHCCAHAFQRPEEKNKLSFQQIKDIADQADEIGIFVINLIGGEPLVWDELDEVIEAIDPKRFHISITTNGWFLTPDVTKHLAAIGVDKLGISIDSGFADVHDSFREKKGSFARALEGVKNAHDAGIRTLISTVATHQNIYTDGFRKLLEISQELNVGLDIQCATVSGGWRGRMDVLIDEKDAEYLETLREKYPLTRRDVWSTPGSKGGCPAITRSVYIISSGEVLPCLFIHISLGNVLKEPLKDIIERGLKIKEFKDFTKLCLAGEDREFIEKYMSRTFDADSLPISFEDGFGDV